MLANKKGMRNFLALCCDPVIPDFIEQMSVFQHPLYVGENHKMIAFLYHISSSFCHLDAFLRALPHSNPSLADAPAPSRQPPPPMLCALRRSEASNFTASLRELEKVQLTSDRKNNLSPDTSHTVTAFILAYNPAASCSSSFYIISELLFQLISL